MSAKYNLQHWNNSYLKDLLIVLLCNIKNDIYLVRNNVGGGESMYSNFSNKC